MQLRSELSCITVRLPEPRGCVRRFMWNRIAELPYGSLHSRIKFPFGCSLPPLSEQTTIATHLDKVTTGIESAIQRAKRQVQLFREYRTRLIADVVTGKLDVREAVARLPDTDPIDAKADGIDSACESTGAECDEMLVVAENLNG